MTTNENPNTEATPFLTAPLNSDLVPTTDALPDGSDTTFAVAASPQRDNDPSPTLTEGTKLVTKQQQRHVLFQSFDPLRFAIESIVNATMNAKCSARYKGVFAVQFDNPNEITSKSVANFCMTGSVFFTPDDIAQHPAFKKVRNKGDGINLSALMTRVKRPTNIDDAAWKAVTEMWADISTVLREKCITPVHSTVANELAASGCGGPKINKKLGGGVSATSEDTYVRLCEAMKTISVKLQLDDQKHS